MGYPYPNFCLCAFWAGLVAHTGRTCFHGLRLGFRLECLGRVGFGALSFKVQGLRFRV